MKSTSIPPQFTGEGDRTTHKALDAVVGALPIGENRGQMKFSAPPSVCFATLAATSPGTPGE